MKTIFTVGAVVLATCLLSGCVNEQKVNQLASNVQTLNAKIARLEQDIKALRPQIYAAKLKLTEPIRVLMLRTILIACAACVCTQNDKKSPAACQLPGIFLTSNCRFRAFLRTSIHRTRLRRRRFFAVAGV